MGKDIDVANLLPKQLDEYVREKHTQEECVGFIDGFEKGWVQLTADQQPFMQGYLPVLSLCQQEFIGLTPIDVETGAGFITPENYKQVGELALRGLR